MSEFIVITGLSGGGRSQAADILEDLGWFVVDNKYSSHARFAGDEGDFVARRVRNARLLEVDLPR